jgi:hypothetical protein
MAYKNKEDALAASARYREKNREKIRERDQQYYRNDIEASRGKSREKAKSYRDRNPESCKKSARMQWRKLRLSIIEYLGGKCVTCGFTDWRAIQVDHINGGGNKERKAFKNHNRYFRSLVGCDKSKYQLLCANCNQIKLYEEHERRIQASG